MTELDELLKQYPSINASRLTMVIDCKANSVGVDGTSKLLSSDADRAVLLHLRKISGLIVTDLATAKAENYRPSKFTDIEVWSKSGNFGEFQKREPTGDNKGLRLVHTPSLPLAVKRAKLLSPNLLFETGPTVSAMLASENLIDEFCLTVTSCRDLEIAKGAAINFASMLNLRQFRISASKSLGAEHFFVLRT